MNTFAAPDGESHIYSTIQDVHDDIEDGLPLVFFYICYLKSIGICMQHETFHHAATDYTNSNQEEMQGEGSGRATKWDYGLLV